MNKIKAIFTLILLTLLVPVVNACAKPEDDAVSEPQIVFANPAVAPDSGKTVILSDKMDVHEQIAALAQEIQRLKLGEASDHGCRSSLHQGNPSSFCARFLSRHRGNQRADPVSRGGKPATEVAPVFAKPAIYAGFWLASSHGCAITVLLSIDRPGATESQVNVAAGLDG